MKLSNLLNLFMYMGLMSCGLLEHRDFEDEMNEYRFDDPPFQASRDFMVVPGDTGIDHRLPVQIKGRTPATTEENHISLYEKSLRRELKHLEFRMNEQEYYQFNKIRDQIGSVSEQIYYLRLGHHQREEYLILRRIKSPETRKSRGYSAHGPARVSFHPEVQRSIASDDVALGMDREKVMNNWGEPVRRDVAGDPAQGNERWAFKRDGKVKYVYFESGRVQGWSQE